MSLSKKSRYIPPHLRDNKKDLVIINPEDEMPPKQKQQQHIQQSQSYHHHPQMAPNAIMNHAANMNMAPNIIHNKTNIAANTNVMHAPPQHSAYASSQSAARRSYRNAPASNKPKSRPLSDSNNNWRKATPIKQPQLNPEDLLPPNGVNVNHAIAAQNVQENSNPNVLNSNSIEMDHNHHHYENQARRYDSRRVNRDRGARGRSRGGYYANTNHANAYRQYNNTAVAYHGAPVMDDDDPNEIQFAKIEAEQHANNAPQEAVAEHNHNHHHNNNINPYDESPFVYSEETEFEDEYHKQTHDAPQQQQQQHAAPQYVKKYVKKEDPRNNINKRESRYNRQYNDNNHNNHNNNEVNENENNATDCNQYELSSNFQTLTTKSRHQQRRRRNHGNNQNGGKNQHETNNCNTNDTKQQSLSPQKSPKQQKNSPLHAGKKKANHQSPNMNAVQLSLGSKKKKAPINWAQELKPKQKAKAQQAQRNTNANVAASASASATFQPHHALDSSQPICSDSGKVRHVLEVKNMKQSDYQNVSSLFRYFEVDFTALLSVKKRWFVVFDHHKTAITALNIVKHNQFKLRRIDTNISDVEMLKNSVPPPVY